MLFVSNVFFFKIRWDETVACLTLMALGSSSPEILLSVIEIVGNNFQSGDLGPGTIVG
jgi:solute carrier family 8 (sodium/calcium exchanger)